MNAIDKAAERFDNGHSCSQAVFSALAEPMGMDYETAVKVSAAFGGGMGRMGRTCGAVTGALMAFGLNRGGASHDAKEETYLLVRQFMETFEARHDSLECRELIACDLSRPEGRQQAEARNTHETVCTQLVRDAVEIAQELLA